MTVTPTNLKITPGVEKLSLAWSASSTEGLGGWVIHYRPKGVTAWTTDELAAEARSFSITGLQAESYEVQVRALVAGGLAQGVATPEAKPAPPVEPPQSALVIGVDTGGWGGSLLAELSAAGIKRVRTSVLSAAHHDELAKAGLTAAAVTVGAYGSLAGRNPQTYAQEWVAAAKVYATPGSEDETRCEVINEPELSSDPTDFAAYVAILKAVYEARNAAFPGKRPKILASWAPTYGFGKGWAALGGLQYVDEVVVHAYGGNAHQHKGLEGGRELIEQAYNESKKPVAVTEVGWPTGRSVGITTPTGDSEQWTELQQAEAIKRFAAWCHSKPYVSVFIYFNAVDYGTNDLYGIERADRTHKLGFKALAEVAA
jgi:hypothetical protein